MLLRLLTIGALGWCLSGCGSETPATAASDEAPESTNPGTDATEVTDDAEPAPEVVVDAGTDPISDAEPPPDDGELGPEDAGAPDGGDADADAESDALSDADMDVLPDPGDDTADTDAADAADAADAPGDADAVTWPDGPDPVLFVHGVNGASTEFTVMMGRLVEAGWPADYLFAYDFEDPSWGCNVDNADAIAGWIADILEATGRPRVDLVAHSMGGLSSRYYMKFLDGTDHVNTYVTLGSMHHGLNSPCWSPIKPCIWEELCATGDFIAQLNADPATPGDVWWVSIFGTADDTVPNESSIIEGAENIEMEGVEHAGANGLTEHPAPHAEVERVLAYPPK